MSEFQKHSDVKMGSEKNFGIVFAVAFSVFAFLPYLHGGSLAWWALVVAATFFVVAIVYPRILKPLNTLWFWVGMLLGAVVAPVVMALVYFVGVTPTGLLIRALGKDLLLLKSQSNAESYWIKRATPVGSMKNQY